MIISASQNRFSAGQQDAFGIPRYCKGAQIVIYGHGAGNNGKEIIGGGGLSSVPPLAQTLVRCGYVVIAPSATHSWGNATSKARINDALTYARNILGASSAPPAGVGASHGFPFLANYKLDNPLACLVGIIPCIDIQAIRVANTGGMRPFIDTAHGIVYPAAMPAGTNPAVETAALSSLPMDIWYASNDNFSVNAATFITATGATGHNVGALGHTNAAILAATPNSIVTFIQNNT